MSDLDYSTVKIIKDGQVTFKSVDEFPSARLSRNREYMRDYNARRVSNNGGALTLEESDRKLYLSEMPHMGGGT